jgi:hypothetical protein
VQTKTQEPLLRFTLLSGVVVVVLLAGVAQCCGFRPEFPDFPVSKATIGSDAVLATCGVFFCWMHSLAKCSKD